MSTLSEKLSASIRTEGPMSVDDWMEACLADPEYGYYRTRDPFGRGGDFITAPEISQMFGELVGLWAGVVWQQLGSPTQFQLIEVGPGRGTLMSDVLRAAAGIDGFLNSATVHLIDISPTLRSIQQETLLSSSLPIEWHTRLSDVPTGPTILIANEFLDALPIRQAVKEEGTWRERRVSFDGDSFVFVVEENVSDRIPSVVIDAPDGSVFEDCPAMDTVVAELSSRFVDAPGAALFIDYGHTETSFGETLQAIKSHQYADPLATPGEADLTAHVDFGALARMAHAGDLAVWGAAPQGAFLERLGLAARAQALLARATPPQAIDIATARMRLAGSDAMGRLFKVMALTSRNLPEPPGFSDVAWASSPGLS